MTKAEIIESLKEQAHDKEMAEIRYHDMISAREAKELREAADLLQSVPEWISVKDRLPTPGKAVLVYAKGKVDGHYDGGFFHITYNTEERDVNSFGWFDPLGVFSDPYEVTHWMPLPVPPMENGGEHE